MPESVLSERTLVRRRGPRVAARLKDYAKILTPSKDNNANPTHTASGSLIVRQGAKYRVLADKQGAPTKAGRFWERLTNNTLPPPPPALVAAPVRIGDREHLQMEGKQRLLRTYDPATNEFQYTRLGKQHYKRARLQYVVKVPSRHAGKRANGRNYTRDRFWSTSVPWPSRIIQTISARSGR